jgi:hypothetical protein
MQLAFKFRDGDPGPDDLECWRLIDGWLGYEVSDWGRVWSYHGGGGRIRLTPKIINGFKRGKTEHIKVRLYRNNGKEIGDFYIHRLVLQAFVGPCPPGMQACHNDGNPRNNRLNNLRWDTNTSNYLDILKHGGRRHKLYAKDISVIWERALAGESDSSIAKDYGVAPGTISSIRTGESWSHITKHLPGWPLKTAAQSVTSAPIYVPTEIANSELELWKQVPDFPGYGISSFGRFATCLDRVGFGFNSHRLADHWKVMSPHKDPKGYLRAQLRRTGSINGKLVTHVMVHRIVLLAFAGPCPPGMVACHNDGNPGNNHASNLRWDSQKANVADMKRNRRSHSV